MAGGGTHSTHPHVGAGPAQTSPAAAPTAWPQGQRLGSAVQGKDFSKNGISRGHRLNQVGMPVS